MKNIFLLFCICPFLCLAQQPGFRNLYSTDSTGAGFVDIVWDGEKLIVSGQYLTQSAPDSAINGLMYMELDTNGNTLFTDIYFHPNDAVAPGILNSLFLSKNGIVYSMNQILYDNLILLALYQNSERILIKTTPIDALQKWLLHCVDWEDNLLFTGRIQNFQYLSEGMIIKSDQMGNEIWRKYYGKENIYCRIAEPTIVDENTIVVPGDQIYWPSFGPVTNIWQKTWILTLDSLGNIKSEWESPKNIESGIISRMVKMPNGNWLYTTSEFIPLPAVNDVAHRPKIVCRDSNFNLVWTKYLSDFKDVSSYIYDITPTADGNYIAVGKWDWYSVNSICKFSPNGEIIWSYYDNISPFPNDDNHLGGIVELPSGSVVAAGYSENFDENKAYGLIIKLNSNGCIDTLCSRTSTTTIASEKIPKIKIYPNPASNFITINNPIGEQIEILDLSGRLIRMVPVNGEIQTIPIQDLPNGAYVIRFHEKTLRVSYIIIKQ